MAYEQKPNSWSLFKNTRKTQDSHPDYTGDGLCECPKCGHTWSSFFDAWLKEGSKGKFFSGRMKAKNVQAPTKSEVKDENLQRARQNDQPQLGTSNQARRPISEDIDEIPF